MITISTGVAWGLSLKNKVSYEIFMNKYIKHYKHYESAHQTINFFDQLYRNWFPVNVFEEKDYEDLGNLSTNYVNENNKLCFGEKENYWHAFFINKKIKKKFKPPSLEYY